MSAADEEEDEDWGGFEESAEAVAKTNDENWDNFEGPNQLTPSTDENWGSFEESKETVHKNDSLDNNSTPTSSQVNAVGTTFPVEPQITPKIEAPLVNFKSSVPMVPIEELKYLLGEQKIEEVRTSLTLYSEI